MTWAVSEMASLYSSSSGIFTLECQKECMYWAAEYVPANMTTGQAIIRALRSDEGYQA